MTLFVCVAGWLSLSLFTWNWFYLHQAECDWHDVNVTLSKCCLLFLCVWRMHRNCCLELSTTLLTASFPAGLHSLLSGSAWRIIANGNLFWWLQKSTSDITTRGWKFSFIHSSFTMDSYRSYWNSSMQSKTWVEGEDQDVYEVESRVPLPRPFPLCSTLNEKNAVVVQTQISHINHRTNGHLLKVISKISLPTPPYTVSLRLVTHTVLDSFKIITRDSCLREFKQSVVRSKELCC